MEQQHARGFGSLYAIYGMLVVATLQLVSLSGEAAVEP